MMLDLKHQFECPADIPAEVIIVAHNRADLLEKCLQSVRTASNIKIHVWDNASNPEIANISNKWSDNYIRSEKNIGFILPNNRIAKTSTSPYTILINSDVILKPGWKEALIGPLLADREIGIVGFQGQKLDLQGKGYGRFSGDDADFVSGWSMAMRTKQCINFGPFDEKELKFALFEDADLCLRMKSTGLKVRALEIILAEHLGGGTFSTMSDRTEAERCAAANQIVFIKRWAGFLSSRRIVGKKA